MENKKIAVVFAGQARTFRYCYKTHLDSLKKKVMSLTFLYIHGVTNGIAIKSAPQRYPKRLSRRPRTIRKRANRNIQT